MENSFDEFWRVYPLKRAKISARTMWDKMVKKYDPEYIIYGARQYAAECQGKEPQYIKYPQGWLSAGRWMDYEMKQESSDVTVRPGSDQWHCWRAYYLRNGMSVSFMDAQAIRGAAWSVPTEWPPQEAKSA